LWLIHDWRLNLEEENRKNLSLLHLFKGKARKKMHKEICGERGDREISGSSHSQIHQREREQGDYGSRTIRLSSAGMSVHPANGKHHSGNTKENEQYNEGN